MGDSGSDIIIKGGRSVELEFNDDVYKKDPGDPAKHKNGTKKITRIVITGDGGSFDSGDHPSGLTCEIEVTCK